MAARQLGGEPALRAWLMVSALDLYHWMRGEEPVPQHVMAKVIAFLAERESTANSAADLPASQATGQKRNLV